MRSKTILKKLKYLILVLVCCIAMFDWYTTDVEASNAGLNKTKATIYAGTTVKLKYTGSGNRKVTWSSAKKSVAEVSKNGVVTGKKKGSTTITAEVGGRKYKCKITVKEGLSQTSATLYAGRVKSGNKIIDKEAIELKLTIPIGKTVTWDSSNYDVVYFTSEYTYGKESQVVVRAKKKGTAVVTATVGNRKYSCKITVKKGTYNQEEWEDIKDNKYSVAGKKAKYTYKIYTLTPEDCLYTGIDNTGYCTVYIKTNNPNSNFRIVDQNGNVVGSSLGNPVFSDVKYKNEKNGKVKGGYVWLVNFVEPGKLELHIEEIVKSYKYEAKYPLVEDDSTGSVVLYTEPTTYKKTLYVKNYDVAKDLWYDEVIAKTTTDKMDVDEKIRSIMSYWDAMSQYTALEYYTDENGGTKKRYLTLTTEYGVPFWITGRVNSATTPAILAEFGKRIGYDLENLYSMNPNGGPCAEYGLDWDTYHYKVRGVYKGKVYYYGNCPPAVATSYEMIDFSKIK